MSRTGDYKIGFTGAPNCKGGKSGEGNQNLNLIIMAISAAMLQELYTEIIAEATLQLYEYSLLLPLCRVKNTAGKPGLTAEFPKWPIVIAGDVAEDDETPETEINPDSVPITVSEKELNIPLTDMAATAVGEEEVIAAIGLLLGSGMARKLDRDIAATFPQFIKTYGTAGVALGVAGMVNGSTYLGVKEAPGTLYGVLHPFQALGPKNSLTNAFGDGTKPLTSEMKANEILYHNYIGTVSGAHYLESASIVPDINDDATGAVFSPLAIGVHIKQLLGFETERKGTRRITHLLGHGKWNAAVVNADWGCALVGDASEPV